MMPPDRKPVFLDAGSNFGGASLQFALATAFDLHLVVLEASPDTFELAKRNLEVLGCACCARMMYLRNSIS